MFNISWIPDLLEKQEKKETTQRKS